MNKKLIRLTEGDLHRIVKESVQRILNEVEDLDLDNVMSQEEEDRRNREYQNNASWAEDQSKDEGDKWMAYKLHNPDAHRNLNVYDGKGHSAMASMATDDEDPTGAIRTYGRGNRGTYQSVANALGDKFPNGIKEPVKWPKKW